MQTEKWKKHGVSTLGFNTAFQVIFGKNWRLYSIHFDSFFSILSATCARYWRKQQWEKKKKSGSLISRSSHSGMEDTENKQMCA